MKQGSLLFLSLCLDGKQSRKEEVKNMNYLNLALIKANLMIAAGASGEDFLSKTISMASSAAIIFGTLYGAWGVVVFLSALKDHNGPDIKNGALQAISGAGICAIGVMINGIDISFG